VETESSQFSDEQFAAALSVGVDQNYWFRARHRLLAQTLTKHLGAGARLLDVGCGPGFAVKYLRDAGFVCFGVELAEPQVTPGAEAFVVTGAAVSDAPAHVADAAQGLLYLDVIEHVPNPVELIEQGLARCPDAQYVVITVPARPEIWTNYDDYYGHFRRYTRSSLEAEAHAAGLVTISVGYLFHSLYFAARAIKLLGKDRALKEEAPKYPMVHRLLAGVLRAESRLLPSALPGTSVLGVFRRSERR
jgi:2-polyprenyl-3-methyl-5-hydroxy-6-metoxy-1,4-benzoquinol methylase